MGRISDPQPVKLFIGMLAARAETFEAAQATLELEFGPVDTAGEIIPFDFTDYYEAEMGPNLLRKFIAFEKLIDPGELASAKLFTNALEDTISERADKRVVNLDPGYLTPAKLVLASTKDYSHRLYLADGIFAEVTMHYSGGRFNAWPWTYPDYQSEAYLEFFESLRNRYRDSLTRVGA
jgi:hypothetical protein